jgi:quercetin dioxygenase-like cupin family protein
MKVNHYETVLQQPVEMEGSSGCKVRWLLGEGDAAPNFAMRQFEVAPGGYTPRHSHPYEHEVFVLEGEGVVFEDNRSHTLKAGDVVLVRPDEVHQFRNTGDQPLKFLCLVPNSATGKKVTVAPECGVEQRAKTELQ